MELNRVIDSPLYEVCNLLGLCCSVVFSSHYSDVIVSNQRCLDCLLHRLFRLRSKKTSKLRVTGLCEENPSVPGGFPSQKASNTENVSIWWRYNEGILLMSLRARVDKIHIIFAIQAYSDLTKYSCCNVKPSFQAPIIKIKWTSSWHSSNTGPPSLRPKCVICI